MKDLLVLCGHLLTTIAKLLGPGGVRAVVADSLLMKQMQALQAYQPTQMLPRLRETFQRLVSELEIIHDIPAASQAISEIAGKIKLIPGEKSLTAEIQGAGNALNVQIKVVAGATLPALFTEDYIYRSHLNRPPGS